MIMVSFCWKMNVLPSKIKNNSVSSTMFLKLTIKVVAFFLGHPVYYAVLLCMYRNAVIAPQVCSIATDAYELQQVYSSHVKGAITSHMTQDSFWKIYLKMQHAKIHNMHSSVLYTATIDFWCKVHTLLFEKSISVIYWLICLYLNK